MRIKRAIVGLVTIAVVGWTSQVGAAGPVSIFTGLDTGYAPLYVAELQGLFAAQGVEATVQTFSSGAEAVTAVRSAKAGYVLAGDLPSLRTWQVGDIVGIAPVSWSTANVSIVASKDVRTPADLKGKSIGVVVGSAPHITLVSYLAKQGIALTDVKIVNLTPGDMTPALNRNDIQALVWGATVTEVATKAVPGAHYLQQGSAGFGVDRTILSATRSTVDAEPKVTEGIVRAFYEGLRVIRQDRDKAVELVARRLKLPAETVARQMGLWNYDMTYNDDFVTFMGNEIRFAVTLKILPEPLELKRHMDTRFLKRISDSLVTAKE